MDTIKAIETLKKRNLNYCLRKGQTDRYSRETDEIISAFVTVNNLSVDRGRKLHAVQLMLKNAMDHPEIERELLEQISDFISKYAK